MRDRSKKDAGIMKNRKIKNHESTRERSSEEEKLKRKAYERELERLHIELVKAQQWIVRRGLKICVVFEGRDGAGKGGTIKAITERVTPRVFRVVALPAPTDREKSQMYLQRYLPHFPAAGEVVIFDKALPREKIRLPGRQKRGGYREVDHPIKFIEEAY